MLSVPQVLFVRLSLKGRCGFIVGIYLCNSGEWKSFGFRGSLVHLQLCNTEEDKDHWTEAHLVKGLIVVSSSLGHQRRLRSATSFRPKLSNSSAMSSPEDAEGLPHPEPHPEC